MNTIDTIGTVGAVVPAVPVVVPSDVGTAVPSDVPEFQPPEYVPFSGTKQRRKVDPPITLQGKEVHRYEATVISEYVDVETGEILPAATLKDNPYLLRTARTSEWCMQRATILGRLRPEVQAFAYFVLKFRNMRRGITPGIKVLVKWYADCYGKKPSHVQRYVPALEKAGVLAGESLLMPLFQVAGSKVSAREHLGEEAMASETYAEIRLKQRLKQRPWKWENYKPFWEDSVQISVPDIPPLKPVIPTLSQRLYFVNSLMRIGVIKEQFPCIC